MTASAVIGQDRRKSARMARGLVGGKYLESYAVRRLDADVGPAAKEPSRNAIQRRANLRTSEPQNLRTSEPQNLRTSEPQNLRTSEPQNLRTSEPQNLRTSQNLSPRARVFAPRARSRLSAGWRPHACHVALATFVDRAMVPPPRFAHPVPRTRRHAYKEAMDEVCVRLVMARDGAASAAQGCRPRFLVTCESQAWRESG